MTNVTLIDMREWDELVKKTYGKPYCFQQQEGCKDRGIFYLTIPSNESQDDEMSDSIPEVVNGDVMGVKFKVWLERDPEQGLKDEEEDDFRNSNFGITLFWHRNFYPDIYTIANDLYNKGLLEKGEYVINIDW